MHVCVGVYGSAFASFVIKTCKCLCKRICRLLRLLQARCAKCPSDKDHHPTDHKGFSMLLASTANKRTNSCKEHATQYK